jgi:hypothetical protein
MHVTQISEEVWMHRDWGRDTQLKEKYSSKQQHEKFVVNLHTHLCPLKAQWLQFVPLGLTFTNCMFCPHSVFMCFVWISEQTAIISLYSINWLTGFYNIDRVCLLQGMDWVFKYNSGYMHRPNLWDAWGGGGKLPCPLNIFSTWLLNLWGANKELEIFSKQLFGCRKDRKMFERPSFFGDAE